MSGHTPGPWAVKPYRGEHGFASEHFRQIDGQGWDALARVVVRMAGGEFDSPEGAANARLIAAAPDMLEALEKALELLEPFDDPELSLGLGKDALTSIRAALNKATKEIEA